MSAPETQPMYAATDFWIASGRGRVTTVSDTMNLPPGFRTRRASANTRPLFGARLITQFEMMTSMELSSTGKASISPRRNSTLAYPPRFALARARSIIAGNLRIAYNDGQHYATLMETRYDGNKWKPFKVDTSGLTGDTGYGSSLAIDAAGHSHIAYTNGKYFASLMYATDAGGSWTATTVDNGGGATRATGYDPSLALDSRGEPHIAYYSGSGQNLRYASLTGTGWTLSTIEHLNNIGMQPSLA